MVQVEVGIAIDAFPVHACTVTGSIHGPATGTPCAARSWIRCGLMTRQWWRSAAVALHRREEWVCAGACEAGGDRGEHDDGEYTGADECGGVLGQHYSRLQ